MNITIPDLTPQECGDIAITAAEGGIGYWSVIGSYEWRRWLVDPFDHSKGNASVPDDFVFYRISTIDDGSGSESFDITPALLRRGFEAGLLAKRNKGGWAVQDLLGIDREDWTGEIDTDAADIIVQFGCFGEVIYG